MNLSTNERDYASPGVSRLREDLALALRAARVGAQMLGERLQSELFFEALRRTLGGGRRHQ